MLKDVLTPISLLYNKTNPGCATQGTFFTAVRGILALLLRIYMMNLVYLAAYVRRPYSPYLAVSNTIAFCAHAGESCSPNYLSTFRVDYHRHLQGCLGGFWTRSTRLWPLCYDVVRAPASFIQLPVSQGPAADDALPPTAESDSFV
jgi:hypothetical protein